MSQHYLDYTFYQKEGLILIFRISELKDSWSGESWASTPAELYGLPDAAVYNEPRELRQNIWSDTWLETYDTVMDFGPYNEGLKLSRRALSLRNA